ncbi:MAG: hypothetical protein IAF94_10180, partial [Pirellulaceae bacterium]|nr:hypothetical protein [Pirellulaceae bacterium]
MLNDEPPEYVYYLHPSPQPPAPPPMLELREVKKSYREPDGKLLPILDI